MRVNMLLIERLKNGRYQLGKTVVDDISSVDGSIKAIKRPIPVTALQLNEQFEVVTTEGIMNANAGDWLIQGVVGEVYICPDEVFRIHA
jgi:hypothetical protein